MKVEEDPGVPGARVPRTLKTKVPHPSFRKYFFHSSLKIFETEFKPLKGCDHIPVTSSCISLYMTTPGPRPRPKAQYRSDRKYTISDMIPMELVDGGPPLGTKR